ncbi:hypothetical protein ACJJIE_04390 [Microbulbifer sp. TRSA001]|uniref:hypothetical protein n=1 Tax=Microbulbifer sp. TRSA001 TaxID=3243381 RepID=UPI00403A0848
MKRKLSDDWGNKKKYPGDKVSKSVKKHFPKYCKHEAYVIYMWSGKDQFDIYYTSLGVNLSSMDIRKEIESSIASMSNSHWGRDDYSESNFFDSGNAD